MRALVSLLVLGSSLGCLAQAPVSGKSQTAGPCSPAVSGHGNTFYIQCKVDEDRGKQMLSVLNKILENQLDAKAVMDKLEEMAKSSKGNTVQQFSAGPNSPNIVGNDNTVTYSDASQLPILSSTQLSVIHDQLASVSMKSLVEIKALSADTDATVFETDLVNIFRGSGWTANEIFAIGPAGVGQSPIAIFVHDPDNTPGAKEVLHILSNLTGTKVQGVIQPEMPPNKIVVVLTSHPIARPQ